MTAVSLVKRAYWLPLPAEERGSFSISDVKMIHMNQLLTLRTFDNLDLDLSCQKKKQLYDDCLNFGRIRVKNYQSRKNKNIKMKLGAFSVSLSVKDINVSKEFYENLGFTVFAGDINKNYLIMKNENALIGLFQGMFAGNILTFNPGWDENA